MGSAVQVEANSNAPAASAKAASVISPSPLGASNSVLVVSPSPQAHPERVSGTVAQVGLVCALALMTLCLTILAAGALDGRPYPGSNSSASIDAPQPAHLQAIANR